ncbi:MAG: YbhB/YbcL family Raf kinase inhibitor-like protein [Betaproteobacteria bacterium]|nr:YbhB/YbcL family Raf kinase inhibitor-like protein [Betaproteobacteria bacterium]
MDFRLTSGAFAPGGAIPSRYTCEGANVSPPLHWSGAPAGTRSFVFILDDPDAPDPAAPRMTWVHWVLYNIPAATDHLPEAVGSSRLPAGTLEGTNDFRTSHYGGPCPPIGRHRYFHKLYALDTELPNLGHPDKSEVLKAMKGHVLAETELVGTYRKGQ